MSERISGVVKWFKNDKGFGFIERVGGGKDVFVHHSAIQANGYRTLREGDRVEFELGDSPKGPCAQNVTVVG